MAGEDRCRHQNQDERRQEDADRRDHGTPEAGDQVTDEGRGDHHRAGADHADRHGDEELALVEPAILLHQPLLEERHDDQPAAESERAGLEEEHQQLAEGRARRGRRQLRQQRGGRDLQHHRRAAHQVAVPEDPDDAGADEQQRHLGLKQHRDHEADAGDRPL
jgi:hypothetical protein